jgi:hypothetical protein
MKYFQISGLFLLLILIQTTAAQAMGVARPRPTDAEPYSVNELLQDLANSGEIKDCLGAAQSREHYPDIEHWGVPHNGCYDQIQFQANRRSSGQPSIYFETSSTCEGYAPAPGPLASDCYVSENKVECQSNFIEAKFDWFYSSYHCYVATLKAELEPAEGLSGRRFKNIRVALYDIGYGKSTGSSIWCPLPILWNQVRSLSCGSTDTCLVYSDLGRRPP